MPDPAPAGLPRRRRFGLRVQLLFLLLPGMLALLVFDSVTDYLDYSGAVTRVYDRALVQPVLALNETVTLDEDGAIALIRPSAVEVMMQVINGRQKFAHVGAVPLDAAGNPDGPERSLLGPADLPGPTPGRPVDSMGDGRGGSVKLYGGQYLGSPLRMAALERVVRDGAGRRYLLRIQAGARTGWRETAQGVLKHHQIIEDARMLLLTIVAVWLGVAWSLRPLERLRDTLQRRGPQQLEPLDPSGVPGEVAPLVDAVNQHIAAHRRLLQEQAQFLADASHQLRTPLAIMMTQAGYALREDDPRKTHETLRAIMDQLSRSRRLSEQLLAMAHASRAEDDGEAALIDLNDVAREVVVQYLALAHEMNQDLGFVDARGEDDGENESEANLEEGSDYGEVGGEDAAPEPAAPAVPVRAQAAELHEALANLLHNAIRHTPAGGRITVIARVQDGRAVAEVRDSGPGLSPDRYEEVFRRFHRDSDPAAATGSGMRRGGAGLGLAIARAYARRNGGDITFAPGEPRPDGGCGLAAKLELPLADPRGA